MKKRFLVCSLVFIMILCNNSMAAFAAESGDDYEDITEEYTYGDTTESSEDAEDGYPSHYFNDTTIPGIIIEANVGEGIIPAQTSIRTKLVSSEVEERVKNSIEGFFNDDQKAVKITAVDIGFVYNNVEIEPKGSINIIMRSDQALEGANHVVVCLKDDQAELLPASQSVIDDYAVNDEGISLRKKEFSFELNGNATIAIVEIEDVPDQKKTDTPTDQSETGKTEFPAEQSETGKTEFPAEQSETGKTEFLAEQSETRKTEFPAEQSETEKNEKPSDKKETERTETSSKQKEAEDSADKNEKIKVSVEIVFDDNKNQDGMRPNYRIAVLKSNGLEKAEIRISEEDNWKGSFENLPKYEKGKDVDYDVEVATPYPYERVSNNSASSNNFIFEFKHIPENVSIKGQIIWKDSNSEIRPKELKITFFENETKKSEMVISKEDNWEFNFGEYPKYKDSKKVQYKVKIEPIEGYNTTYSEGSFNITNEYIEKNNSKSDNVVSPKSGDKNGNRIVIYVLFAIVSLAIIFILKYCLDKGFFDNF